MASAGSIYVDLLLNDGKYVQGLNRSKSATSNAAASWQRDISKARVSFTSIVSPVESIGKSIGALSGIVAGAFSVQKIIAYSDQYKGLQSRLSLVTGSAQELADVQEKLFRIAQDTSQPLAATIDAYARLSQSLNSTQKSQTDLIRLTDLLSKTLVISGTDAAGAATFYQQFGQAASSDFKAIGQELQTFADQNPRFYGILKNEANKYGKTLKDMAKDGELSFEFISKAVLASGEVIDKQAGGIALTVGKSFTQLNNSFLELIGNSTFLNEATGLTAEAVQTLAQYLDELNDSGISVNSTFVGIGTLFLDLAKNFKEFQAANAEKLNFFGLNDERVAKLKQEAADYQKMIDDLGVSLLEAEENSKKLNNTVTRTPEAASAPLVDEKAAKAAKKTQEELQRLYEKNETYITGLNKETISYIDSQEEVNRLFDAGKISADEYYTALSNIDKAYDESSKKASIWGFDVEEAGKQAARNVQDEFADFLFDPFEKGLDGMLMGFLNVIKRMAAEAAAAKILEGLFGSDGIDIGSIIGKVGGAFAGGSVSSSASTSAGADAFLGDYFDGMFADGGYIKPGHFGIAGEAGAELVFGGTAGATVIPQSGSAGDGVTVNIINNAGANVSQQQRQTNNGTEIDIMIDQVVANKMSTPGSKTNSAMKAFNQQSLVKR